MTLDEAIAAETAGERVELPEIVIKFSAKLMENFRAYLADPDVQAGFEYYESLRPDQRRRYAHWTPKQLASAKLARGQHSLANNRPTARPRQRRERHVARATSSGDSGDDGPGLEPPKRRRIVVDSRYFVVAVVA